MKHRSEGGAQEASDLRNGGGVRHVKVRRHGAATTNRAVVTENNRLHRDGGGEGTAALEHKHGVIATGSAFGEYEQGGGHGVGDVSYSFSFRGGPALREKKYPETGSKV